MVITQEQLQKTVSIMLLMCIVSDAQEEQLETEFLELDELGRSMNDQYFHGTDVCDLDDDVFDMEYQFCDEEKEDT